MEKINEHNYEVFFLDYHEGRLSPGQVAELLLFVEQHPERKELFEDFQVTPVTFNKEEKYGNKEGLKKQIINLLDYEEYFIASAEGILNEQEQKNLLVFLNENPSLQKEHDLFLRTRIKPYKPFVYPHKEKLKRRRGIPVPFKIYPYLAAAASLALIIGLWFVNRETALYAPFSESAAYHIPEPVNGKLRNTAVVQEAAKKGKEKEYRQKTAEIKTVSSGSPALKSTGGHEQEEIAEVNNRKLSVIPDSSPGLQNLSLLDLPSYSITDKEPFRVNDQFPDLKTLAEKKVITTLTGSDNQNKEKSHIGWELAKVAARSYGRLTGKKISVKENYNKNGVLVSYALQGTGFAYQKTKTE